MGRFLSSIEYFDAHLFRLKTSEALGLDPQTRILLECNLKVLKDTEWNSYIENDFGVYIGVMHMEYIQYLSREGIDIQPSITTGNGMDFMIGRISFSFSLVGPCISTHTACSSSLVGLHLGKSDLENAICQNALCSGVFVILYVDSMHAIGQLKAFSADGRCKTFSSSADGYGRGEGSATFGLSGSDKNMIAYISGSSVRHSGKSSGLTVPHGPSQSSLIKSTIEKAGVSINHVIGISCHGTGTLLGDPIEVGGIKSVLKLDRKLNSPKLLFASKTLLGHTEGSAGISGGLFAVASMKSRCIAPTLHLTDLNYHVANTMGREDNRYSIPRESCALVTAMSRYIGTSSFGMSGVNAHMIFEDSTEIRFPSKKIFTDKRRFWYIPCRRKHIEKVFIPKRNILMYQVTTNRIPSLSDHCVVGRVIMPGAGMLDIFFSALNVTYTITSSNVANFQLSLSILKPIDISRNDIFECRVDLGIGSLDLTRHKDIHATGMVTSISHLGREVENYVSHRDHFGIRGLSSDDVPILSQIHRRGCENSRSDGFSLDPFLTDASLHSAIAMQRDDMKISIPVNFSFTHIKEKNAPFNAGFSCLSLSGGNLTVVVYRVVCLPRIELAPLSKHESAVQTNFSEYNYNYKIVEEVCSPLHDGALDLVAPAVKFAGGHVSEDILREMQRIRVLSQQSRISNNVQNISLLSENTGLEIVNSARNKMKETSLHALFKVATTESLLDINITLVDHHSSKRNTVLDDLNAKQYGRNVKRSYVCDSRLTKCNKILIPSSHILKMTDLGVSQYQKPNLSNDHGCRIRIHSVSLNFRDVMISLGLYPGKNGVVGSDCSGVLIKTEGGTDIAVGDRVFGLIPGCFGSEIDVQYPDMLARVPNNLSFEEAASVPTVYSTALLCLGRTRPGERLLVHAGSGGLGAATIELARSLDCICHSTAGNLTKRNFIRKYSKCQFVGNSRNTSFVDDLKQVDRIINSLTSPGMVSASLSMLSRFGKFIEVGKRDIWSIARITEERQDVLSSFVALDYMPPRAIRSLLEQLQQMFCKGTIQPPRSVCYSIANIKMAFKIYSQSSHLGKIVVSAARTSRTRFSESSWLITGGQGALGQISIKFLIAQGIQYVISLTKKSKSLNRTIENSRCLVEVVFCDPSATEDWAQLDYITLNREASGLIHSAGVSEDASLIQQTPGYVRRVLAPKVSISHQRHCHLPLHEYLNYSSISSLFGSAGQSNYAAANGALDGISSLSRGAGINVVPIQWGAWSAGMAESSIVRKSSLKTGLGFLEPREAMDSLDLALSNDICPKTRIIIFKVNWRKALWKSHSLPWMLHEFKSSSSMEAFKLKVSHDASLNMLSLSEIERKISGLCDDITGTYGSLDDPIMDRGIDSLSMIELQNSVNRSLDAAIDASDILNYPSVRALSHYIYRKLQARYEETGLNKLSDFVIEDNITMKHLKRNIGITAIIEKPLSACSKFGVTTLDHIACIPASRWDIDRIWGIHGLKQPRFGYFMQDIYKFDNGLFRISPTEAESIDPQHRVILEAVMEAKQHVQLSSDASVIVGIGTSDYLYFINSVEEDGYFASGCASSAASGRVSFLFNMKGESIAIDTACSSSSVATHICYTSLKHGSSYDGVVSGVNVILNPQKSTIFSLSGMLSLDGRCKTLDEAANGYVRSECCVVIALNVHVEDFLAFIIGTCVNQDGMSASLTAPNGPAQERVIAGALKEAREIPPAIALGLHGTGTELGDPIEMGSVCKLFSKNLTIISARKSVLGHSETGSGLSGIVNQIKQQCFMDINAITHLRHLNNHVHTIVGSKELKCFIPREKGPNCVSETIICGSSAFAFQGTNSHVVTKSEYPEVFDQTSKELAWVKSNFSVLPIIERFNLLKIKKLEISFSGRLPRNNAYASSITPLFASVWMLQEFARCLGLQIIYNVQSKLPSLTKICWGSHNIVVSITVNKLAFVELDDSALEFGIGPIIACTSGRTECLPLRWRTFQRVGVVQSRFCVISVNKASDFLHKSMASWAVFSALRRNDLGYTLRVNGYFENEFDVSTSEYFLMDQYRLNLNGINIQVSDDCRSECEMMYSLKEIRKHARSKQENVRVVFVHTNSSVEELQSIFDKSDQTEGLVIVHAKYLRSQSTLNSTNLEEDLLVSKMEQLLAISRYCDATHILNVVDQNSEKYTSPYDSSTIWFYQSFGLASIMRKYGVITLIGSTPNLEIDSLAAGVTKASMLENHRPNHIPFLRIFGSSIAKNVFIYSLEKSDEFEIDIWNDYIVCGRLCEGIKRSIHQRDKFEEVKSSHCVIIAGGTRGLGGYFAHQIATQNTIFVLASRSGIFEDKMMHREIKKRAHSVFVKKCDWADIASVVKLLNWVRENMPVVSLIVHAAGSINSCSILDIENGEFDAVVTCKMNSLRLSLDFPSLYQILISSVCSIWSQSGGSHYTAASIYQNKIAHLYRERGIDVQSGAFGPFSHVGMSSTYADEMEYLGLKPSHPKEISEAFQNSCWESNFIYANMDFEKLIRVTSSKGHMGIFDRILPRYSCQRDVKGFVVDDALDNEENLSKEFIEEYIIQLMKDYLVYNDVDQLVDIDSLTAVEVAASLSKLINRQVPATTMFDYPTISSLTNYIVESIIKVDSFNDYGGLDTSKSSQRGEKMDDLIIGWLQCRLPRQFGGDAVSVTPLSRWQNDFLDFMHVPFGTWLDGIDYFDSNAFGIMSSEAQVMDPQHRSLLEIVSETAGVFNFHLKTNIGVYVGIQHAEYVSLYNKYTDQINSFTSTSSAFSVASGRIAYTFALQGPAMSLDTACSSAFSALHVGRSDLLCKRTDMSITCAINMMMSEKTTRSTTISGMLSRDGRCKTLDTAANGYVRGEAVACLVIERHENKFEIDPHYLQEHYFVINASYINQDGRTTTLTAPNGPSQQRLIKGAISHAKLVTSDISSIHMHGTGTSLGDPIEFGALKNIFSSGAELFTLGASKSLYGHSEPASGFVSLKQAFSNMLHHQVQQIQHLRYLNNFLVEESNFRSWNPKISRQQSMSCVGAACQGISAFAFQGTNAHVIVSEKPEVSYPDEANNLIWKKQRYWYCIRARILLHSSIKSSKDSQISFVSKVSSRSSIYDHVVSGKVILPATAILEISVASALASGNEEREQCRHICIGSFVVYKPTLLTGRDKDDDLTVGIENNKISVFNRLQRVSGSHIIGTVSSNHKKRHVSVKDRLYQQFVESASKAFNLSPTCTPIALPIAKINHQRAVSEGLCVTYPEISDAATQTQIAQYNQSSSDTYLPSAIYIFYVKDDDFCINKQVWSRCQVSALHGKLNTCIKITHEYLLSTEFVDIESRKMQRDERPLHFQTKQENLAQSHQSDQVEHFETEIRIATIVNRILGSDVPRQVPLFDAGVDSLTSLDIINQINESFSTNLGATAVYDAPDISALASLVVSQQLTISHPIQEEKKATISGPGPSVMISDTKISDSLIILGISYRYPGMSENVVKSNPFRIAEETSIKVPFQRWDVEIKYTVRQQCRPGFSYARFGKFLQNIEYFDEKLFSMTEKDAFCTDPQQRLLLEDVAMIALDKNVQAMSSTGTGVFTGCMYQEYLQYQFLNGQKVVPSLITGNGQSYLPARISYTFNFEGPSVGTDTACSSSLISLHQAANSIKHDGVQDSIVSGINLILLESTTMSICQMYALSESGRCKTFDSSADGYVRGEAAVTMFISRLHDQGDKLAILSSSHINQDGRSNGITAPNGQAQAKLIKASVGEHAKYYRVHSSHGTGTELGDPIEVNALQKGLNFRKGEHTQSMSLSASKSTVGHTEGAAGLTGALLCIQGSTYNTNCEVAHLRNNNRYVTVSLTQNFAFMARQHSPLTLTEDFSIHGTSSFGMGGTNAHASIQTYRHFCLSDGKSSISNSNQKLKMVKKRYWPLPHLDICIPYWSKVRRSWSIRLLRPSTEGLLDHVINGAQLVPGALWVYIAVICHQCYEGSNSSTTGDISFKRPYEITAEDLNHSLNVEIDNRNGQMTINSNQENGSRASSFECRILKASEQNGKGFMKCPTKTTNIFSGTKFEFAWTFSCLSKESNCNFSAYPASIDNFFHLPAIVSSSERSYIPVQIKCMFMRENIIIPDFKISAFVRQEDNMPISNVTGSSDTVNCHVTDLISVPAKIERKSTKLFKKSDISQRVFYSVNYKAHSSTCLDGAISNTRPVEFSTENTKVSSRLTLGNLSLCVDFTSLCAQFTSQKVQKMSISTRDAFIPVHEIRPILNMEVRGIWGMIRSLDSETGNRLAINALDRDQNLTKYHTVETGGVTGVTQRSNCQFRPYLKTCNLNYRAMQHGPLDNSKANLLLGGTDGIGLLAFTWIGIHIGHITATGRSGYMKTSQEVAPKAGTIIKSDTSIQSDVSMLMGRIRAVNICFFSAGTHDDRPLNDQTPGSIKKVFAPKVGCWSLISSSLKKGWYSSLYTFSSISSLIGTAGQSNYASANLHMEAASSILEQSGCPIKSISWGAWTTIGMAKLHKKAIGNSLKYGFGVLNPTLGLKYIETALNRPNFIHVLIASPLNLDGAYWKHSELIERLEIAGDILTKSGIGSVHQSVKEVLERIEVHVRHILGPGISRTDPLMSVGLDSITSMELREAIAEEFQLDLPATLAFDYPNILSIADHVTGMTNPRTFNIQQRAYGHPTRKKDLITIDRIQSSYPSGTEMDLNMDILLQLSLDIQRIVPRSRWDIEHEYSVSQDGMYARFGGFYQDITIFDASIFKMTNLEGKFVDPQQRMLLQGAFEMLKTPSHYNYENSGVYIGCMNFEFAEILSVSKDSLMSFSATGTSANFMVGRLSYYFGFNGPSIAIDTACSSSLVGAHTGRMAILHENLDGCISGGINLMLSPITTAALCKLRALSLEGRCRSLESSADGYGRSEGNILMFLRNLSIDDPTAVFIVSTVLNQDGRSSSLTAPNGPSQGRLLINALSVGQLAPQDVSVASIHGTGTNLGDPIEINALHNVFQGAGSSLLLQSFKSAGGHNEGAAGLSGLALACYSIMQKSVAKINHLRWINPHVSFIFQRYPGKRNYSIPRETGPFCITSEFAKSSSFGMSGTNAAAITSSEYLTCVKYCHSSDLLRGKSLWPVPIFQEGVILGIPRDLRTIHFEFRNEVAELKTLCYSETLLASIFLSSGSYISNGRVDIIIGDILIVPNAEKFTDFCCRINIENGLIESDSNTQKIGQSTLKNIAVKIGSPTDSKTAFKPPYVHLLHVLDTKIDSIPTFGRLDSRTFKNIYKRVADIQAVKDLCSFHNGSIGSKTYSLLDEINETDGYGIQYLSCSATYGYTGKICASFKVQDSYKVESEDTHGQIQNYDEKWIPKRLVNNLKQDKRKGCCVLDLGSVDIQKSYSIFFVNSYQNLKRSKLVKDLRNISAPSIYHITCMIAHSELGHMFLLGSSTKQSRKHDILWLYDILYLLNLDKIIKLSSLQFCDEQRQVLGQIGLSRALSRTFFLEKRALFAPNVLLQSEANDIYPDVSLWNLINQAGEYEIKIDSARLHVRRLAQGRHSCRSAVRVPSSVLILGGATGLGFQFARFYVVKSNCKHIGISSRSGHMLPGEVSDFGNHVSSITLFRSDCMDSSDNRDLGKILHEEFPRFEQIVYASGISIDARIGDLQIGPCRRVISTKVGSLDSLGEQTHTCEIYLSSVASLWSQIGGTYYTAANAILDSRSVERHRRGEEALSLQLGPFYGQGLAKEHEEKFRIIGIHPFAIMKICDLYMTATMPITSCVQIEIEQLVRAFSLRGPWKFASELISDLPTEPKLPPKPTIEKSIVKDDAEKLHDIILYTFHEFLQVSDDGDIDFQAIDSIVAVEISRSLSQRLGLTLAVTLIYDHPSINAVFRYISRLTGVEIESEIDHEISTKLKHHREYHLVYGVQQIDLPTCLENHSDLISLLPYNRWDPEESPVRYLFVSVCQNHYLIEFS